MPESRRKSLPAGLYDQPITRDLLDAISRLPQDLVEQAKLSPDRAPEVLARLLHDRLYHSLAALKGKDRSELQLDLTNQILKLLATNIGEGGAGAGDEVAAPAEVLRAILAEPTGVLAVPEAPERPKIALSNSELLTNGPNDVSVGPEIRRELASADRVDLLCSFLKWHGLRVIDEPLREFLIRNPDGLRVLTTTYIGATERRALDALSEMGAKIRISYDTGRTRLHAKAWLFHRNSGFSTAYVGSSNLSATAMLDGLEWNVRLSQTDNGPILRKFETAFEQYWSDSQFESYQHGRDAERFDRAIRDERRGKGREDADGTAVLPAIDLTARPHQQEILDDLAAERESGHTRNLVVAATGTGKTVVSALDYRRLAKSMGTSDNRQPSLLFVAHRDEILRQSQATFRLALRDGRFGERLVAGEVPTDGRHVFASIQSLTESRLKDLAPDAYDIVIIDEFHHAAAPSYDRLLKHLRPKVLLGLTATPERTDGKPILHHFDDRIASELRLWRALDQGLLSPFQYFGLHGPDVSFVKWVRGRYDSTALSNVYTADHAFALRVVQEVQQKVTDIKSMKALGFCVDVAHANFMATQFAKAGVHATAISGGTPRTEREAALGALKNGDIQALFSVDLFNEGIDLPSVDTILFLRPTESATLFLQQLGRGLRLDDDKPCCTVLDFIGGANRKFRFDLRFRAIVGGTRRHVERQVKEGFPLLPSGCAIILDRESQASVLANIRSQLGSGQKGLVEDLRALGEGTRLPGFLAETGFDLEDVYDKSGKCFEELRRRAGFANKDHRRPDEADVTVMENAIARMLHIDDGERLTAYKEFLLAASPPTADSQDVTQRMLFGLLGFARYEFSHLDTAWSALWACKVLRAELLEVIDLLADRSRRLTHKLEGRLRMLPFQVHATYTLDEVMAGVDARFKKTDSIYKPREGVYYSRPHACDLLFVTLEKNEKDYTPTTLYRDYPLSREVFHWETQPSCHERTPNGQRYLQFRSERFAADQALLFVRERRNDARGETMPYLHLGPVSYLKHSGARPMEIDWKLAVPMPTRDFQEMKVAAG